MFDDCDLATLRGFSAASFGFGSHLLDNQFHTKEEKFFVAVGEKSFTYLSKKNVNIVKKSMETLRGLIELKKKYDKLNVGIITTLTGENDSSIKKRS